MNSWGFIELKEPNTAEKLERVCETEVVFYDELAKASDHKLCEN